MRQKYSILYSSCGLYLQKKAISSLCEAEFMLSRYRPPSSFPIHRPAKIQCTPSLEIRKKNNQPQCRPLPHTEAPTDRIVQIEHPPFRHTSIVPHSYLSRTWFVPAPYKIPLYGTKQKRIRLVAAEVESDFWNIALHVQICPKTILLSLPPCTRFIHAPNCHIYIGKERTEPHQRISLSNCFKGK